jgi:glucose-1-phosphate thymidylyltransferase
VKGIVLAGGNGSRLYPMTATITKQLLPIYDKPMIYYPIATLMLAGIREILLITTPKDVDRYRDLLGDGARWGLEIRYATQALPNGIAQAYLIGRDFVNHRPSALVLGDNLFFGSGLSRHLTVAARLTHGAHIFACRVEDPERYGVVELDARGQPLAIVEKPPAPRSNRAVTGLYFYDGRAADLARELRPSPRGELEISDLNATYLAAGELIVTRLGRGFAWLDTGTCDSLLEAAEFVRTIQHRQALPIACLEEIAFRRGWIDAVQVGKAAEEHEGTRYGSYLAALASGGPR